MGCMVRDVNLGIWDISIGLRMIRISEKLIPYIPELPGGSKLKTKIAARK